MWTLYPSVEIGGEKKAVQVPAGKDYHYTFVHVKRGDGEYACQLLSG
ncbi:MAG TPA: hypothetical protein PL182_12965 [Pseudobdellovibrionaceae bacterium]|nr:hypothetical protein [Pseudobdellovibrionaceae bacterium]